MTSRGGLLVDDSEAPAHWRTGRVDERWQRLQLRQGEWGAGGQVPTRGAACPELHLLELHAASA